MKKKIMMGLGALTAAVAPITTLVACGDNGKGSTKTVLSKKTSAELKNFIQNMDVYKGNNKLKEFTKNEEKISELTKILDQFYTNKSILTPAYKKLLGYKDELMKLLIDKKIIKSTYKTDKIQDDFGSESKIVGYIEFTIDKLLEIVVEQKDNADKMKSKIIEIVTDENQKGVKILKKDLTDDLYSKIIGIFIKVTNVLEKNKEYSKKVKSLYDKIQKFEDKQGIYSDDSLKIRKKFMKIIPNDNPYKNLAIDYSGIRHYDFIKNFFLDLRK